MRKPENPEEGESKVIVKNGGFLALSPLFTESLSVPPNAKPKRYWTYA